MVVRKFFRLLRGHNEVKAFLIRFLRVKLQRQFNAAAVLYTVNGLSHVSNLTTRVSLSGVGSKLVASVWSGSVCVQYGNLTTVFKGRQYARIV